MPARIALDAAQEAVGRKLDALGEVLRTWRPERNRLFARRAAPRGLYLWGEVGRGKSMLVNEFFENARVVKKRRMHFNAFMAEVHARIHQVRSRDAGGPARKADTGRDRDTGPIPDVARSIAAESRLLSLDEFEVRDVTDAMILGRLFQRFLAHGIVVVATSNTPPQRLFDGGLNRQLFLPFVSLVEHRLDIVELEGDRDYRLGRVAGLNLYVTPLGPQADAALNSAWSRLTDGAPGEPETVDVLGRKISIPRAAHGAARLSFSELCAKPLAAADYLAIARRYHVLFIDRIPLMTAHMGEPARRFSILIDTLYDQGVKLACSAAVPPEALHPGHVESAAFRRTVSRLLEMQSVDYVGREHGPRTRALRRPEERRCAG